MAIDVECPRRFFTAEEFERMAAAGIFGPEERLELIDGEIVEMSPVGPGHGASIACLNKRFILGPTTFCWSSRSPTLHFVTIADARWGFTRSRASRSTGGSASRVNGDTIAPLSFPDLVITVADIFA